MVSHGAANPSAEAEGYIYRMPRMGLGWSLCFNHIWVVVALMGMIGVQLVLRGSHPCRVRGSGTVLLERRGLTYSPLWIDVLFGIWNLEVRRDIRTGKNLHP